METLIKLGRERGFMFFEGYADGSYIELTLTSRSRGRGSVINIGIPLNSNINDTTDTSFSIEYFSEDDSDRNIKMKYTTIPNIIEIIKTLKA